MRYHCTECSYIYDESLGDSVDGIEAGTKAEELSQCPACDAEDSFYPITEEVNYFDEKSEYIPLIDAEHYPIVEVIAGQCTVQIPDHAMLDEHRISSISLYDEYGDMVEELFLQPEVVAEASFDVSDMDEFEIRVRCNLHGVWGKKFQND